MNKQHHELLSKIKKFSEKVDQHVFKRKLIGNKQRQIYSREDIINQEIECAEMKQNIYKKDIKYLKEKIAANLDTLGAVDIEKSISQAIDKQNKLIAERKVLQQKIEGTHKKIEKEILSKNSEVLITEEERVLKMIENEKKKEILLKNRLKSINEAAEAKNQLIKTLEQSIVGITEDINKIKPMTNVKPKTEPAIQLEDRKKLKRDGELVQQEYLSSIELKKRKLFPLKNKLETLKNEWVSINRVRVEYLQNSEIRSICIKYQN